MNRHKELDLVLNILAKEKNHIYISSLSLYKKINPETISTNLDVLLEHLVDINYASSITTDQKSITQVNHKAYRITFQGLLFLEKTSFKDEISKGKRMAIWTVAKIIAVIINAIIIIIIGIASIYVPFKSNQKDEEIKLLNLKIDSLETVKKLVNIDSLKRIKK
jgi:cell division protein FtsL